MSCPFLRETVVRSCDAAPLRKPLANVCEPGATDKCSSAEHASCPVFRARGGVETGACSFFHESPVQYCGAASVTRYLPYSPAEATRCGSEAYRYCDAYLALQRPYSGDEVSAPEHLYYTPNHLWLDVGESGLCHVGIDGLLARLLGSIERVSYLTSNGTRRPGAVVRVCGVDWPLVFPNSLLIDRTNAQLRADPSRITRDPYGAGWMFAGYQPPGADPAASRLVHGRHAVAWMSQEARRLTDWLQRRLAARMGEPQLACDGGWIAEGAAHLLRREELFDVLHEFFAPHADWTKES